MAHMKRCFSSLLLQQKTVMGQYKNQTENLGNATSYNTRNNGSGLLSEVQRVS